MFFNPNYLHSSGFLYIFALHLGNKTPSKTMTMSKKVYLSPAFKGCGKGESPLDKSLNFFLFNDAGMLAQLKRRFGNNLAVSTDILCNEKTGVVESVIIKPFTDDPVIRESLTYHLHGIFGPSLTGIWGEDEVWDDIREIIGERTFRKYFPDHPISFDNLQLGVFCANGDKEGKVSLETSLGDSVFTIGKDEKGHAVFQFKENDDVDFATVECQLLDAMTLMERHSYFRRPKDKDKD